MTSIIALDLETTGLDPKSDKIIEIGAIKFNGNRVEGEFKQLINPGCSITPFITKLTGINNSMLVNAPSFEEISQDLETFVGPNPILGHNVQFDISFLNQANLFKHNDLIDTYDMASVLLPNAGRYNLSALGQLLNVPFLATHRALDDARVTKQVYSILREKIIDLPIDILAEIVRLGEFCPWGGELPFREMFKLRIKGHSTEPKGRSFQGPIFSTPPPPNVDPRIQNESLIPLDIEEISSLLEHGGLLSKKKPDFEHRPEQIELCQRISSAISEGRHLIAEAGTGTGKSMAYLLPAAQWSIQNNCRVVISTNTINLQDQLINKDILEVKDLIGENLITAVLKGRNNYLCPRRLEAFRKKKPETSAELRVYAKVLIWLLNTTSGDKAEINLNGPSERFVWSQLSSSDIACSGETCKTRMGGICPQNRAKQQANQAHIIVVNHSLLLADVATGNRILPDYDYLIIDEAHHMEAATTNALSFQINQIEIDRTLKELGGVNAGILGRLHLIVKKYYEPTAFAAINKLIEQLTDKTFQFQNASKLFFRAILGFLEDQREGRNPGNYSQQERILPSTRIQSNWLSVEIAWEEAQRYLEILMDALKSLTDELKDPPKESANEIEDWINNLGSIYLQFLELHKHVTGLVFEPNEEMVYWVELNPNSGQVLLQAAPLHIGKLMEDYLWHEKAAVILTSATLASNDDFNYIRGRLNAWDADVLKVGSPFDYENSTLLYLPNDMPEPNNRAAHQKAVENAITNLCLQSGGKSLFLFTSYLQLTTTTAAIANKLAENDIAIFEQGQGASPHSLLEAFKASQRAALFGTRSFWEGVDIPGDDLSILGIVKLPFSVPSDPIIAARAETFDQPFYDFFVPEAIISFRQGFGRLIRTKQDRGLVVILDPRVLTKQYGKLFIESLPQCTLRTGPIQNLPKMAVDWLGY